MATMWPRLLPAAIRAESRRAAEIRVFDALAAQLGLGWTVFYSRPWLGETASGAEIDGESDFVVAHPDHGVLFIEVKGGAISYDPATDRWTSRDRHGINHTIKNPVEQASKSKHALLRKAQAERGWPRGHFRFRHGVIFPDVQAVPQHMGPDKPRELFATRPELEHLADWVAQRLSGGNDDALGPHGTRVLEQLLARPIQLHSPLAYSSADDDEAIENLTPQQFHILNAFEDLRRVAISGGAGTGKTVLACEDARRLAAAGQRTLLTCGSAQLAEHIRLVLRDSGVEVSTFSELARHLGTEARILTGATTPRSEQLPEVVFDSLAARPDLAYDAVVVDEAQDFTPSTWVSIDALASRSDGATLHAYFDSNQRLYGELRSHFDAYTLLPIRLSRNLRNTQNIHAATQRFYRGPGLIADGPVGAEVQWLPCDDGQIERTTLNQVRRLINAEDVLPGDIAVLSPGSTSLTALATPLRDQVYAGLTLSTIVNFKGLERRFVIVLATRDLSDVPELAYVALSRARVHLMAVGPAEVLDWLRTDAPRA
ncbi:NERD domain-containing protein/DEAD/DEAH box helicase [Pseudoxanthomonas sp. PXM01]|uniref:NERD domain-containing protein n=1 Tax=Pseudoxanthomonas sp. PXM01 TaxID=2769295 RepID=UPI0017860822|nr:NERD domain-containing protein/DEAD/DEAH box helicase [Pseudoxanthomonas sp. PXM01]MBD9470389.1 NERD domain-containing protein [Pseudoxanthomonas sp. PXM01]